jgi:hypothetical protein
MSGDTNNVTLWPDADVFIGSVASTNPADGVDFALTGSNPWAFAGILDGEAGFGETQNADSNNFFGWGVGIVATGRRNLVITRTFTAIEDNKQSLALRYDTSGITFSSGGRTGTLAGRDLQAKFKFGFQLQKGSTLHRRICKNYAQIETLGDVTEGENNIFSLPVTVTIYPEIDSTTGKPIYWQEYVGPVVVVP